MSSSSLPRMLRVRQQFPAPPPLDLKLALPAELARLAPKLKKGARIAVAVGSRGIAHLRTVVAGAIEYLKAAGTEPFIVPAMGSHGGATPEGQVELLGEYGITERDLAVPIRASMESGQIGSTPEGIAVFFSEEAMKADGVLVINRVRPHTDFQSEIIGSGLLKMLVVGLGKRRGAANFHAAASRFGYEQVLRTSARITCRTAPVLGGLALIENQFHDIAKIAAIPVENMEERESELYREAKALMPRLPFSEIDLLIIDRMGKNISGAGMDPNVIGRSLHGYSALQTEPSTGPSVRRIFVRDLTPESHGNAVGLGLADFTTSRLVRGMDARVTYLNSLTALSLQSAKIPIHFETDREAIERALETLTEKENTPVNVVRIQDTLNLEGVEVSETLLEQVRQRADLKPMSEPATMAFDSAGNLPDLVCSK